MFFICVIVNKCIMCMSCVHICPVKCIIGCVKKRIFVLTYECINCLKCFKICPKNAITSIGSIQMFLIISKIYFIK